jgi:hypothetical protein
MMEYQTNKGSDKPLLEGPNGDDLIPLEVEEQQEHEIYEVSPKRWAVLASFALCLASTQYVLITFSPIAVITAKSYGVSMFEVNSGVTVFLASAILFNFASM